ncbi:hypothetical protein Ctob_011303 [Chrysochromulina tobinii]|uniref:Myosin motor domain-containing protein n=1 Tax=Chrysochromulina tobinii TaxID=1460289 RepID=A0A0M0K1C2_9EUKA|nr:hypothetical protein Ctob_011303 [Chrysochromulina tobinii]|eukprot:KOO32188.1 hypothetical protein Ctob_011303 [Chrysochromulina sp. CCMP291]
MKGHHIAEVERLRVAAQEELRAQRAELERVREQLARANARAEEAAQALAARVDAGTASQREQKAAAAKKAANEKAAAAKKAAEPTAVAMLGDALKPDLDVLVGVYLKFSARAEAHDEAHAVKKTVSEMTAASTNADTPNLAHVLACREHWPVRKGEACVWVLGPHRDDSSPMYEIRHPDNARDIDVVTGRPRKTWPYHEEDFEKADMCEMLNIDEPNILRILRKRHSTGQPYTRAGPNSILISVNPYRDLGLYTTEAVYKYRDSRSTDLPPHIFQMAAEAYSELREHGKNQSIISSGESGAGKTENTKQVFFFLAQVAATNAATDAAAAIRDQLLASNYVLEAFGNAKTVRNNNSSRFGKLVNVRFDAVARLSGTSIDTYLLEKSRISSPNMDERNYHFFFQLLRGLPETELMARQLVADPKEFESLRGGGASVFDVEHVDDRQEFSVTREAMNDLGIPAGSLDVFGQRQIFDVVAAVLHLGNVSIIRDQEMKADSYAPSLREAGGYAKVHDPRRALMNAADLLGVDANRLKNALVMRPAIKAGGPSIGPQSVAKAIGLKKSLAETLYSKLFDWLVETINAQRPPKGPYTISVLDIFGFEVFDVNSLEQLCINFCNEKLQKNFTDTIFELEQGQYKKEGVAFERVEFVDNHLVISLIESELEWKQNKEGEAC